jgi:hypothetical protein
MLLATKAFVCEGVSTLAERGRIAPRLSSFRLDSDLVQGLSQWHNLHVVVNTEPIGYDNAETLMPHWAQQLAWLRAGSPKTPIRMKCSTAAPPASL